MNRVTISLSLFALLLLLLAGCSKSGADNDGDEDESPRAANKVEPEVSAPIQPAGKEFVYNFDNDAAGKSVSGDVDRAAGLVFRLKDANNYYIVRANALEDNYRLYHVVNGNRVQFAGANFKVASGEWHELRVECVGNHITCYYDNEKKIDATDDTFKEAGKVGLWTKADSVTYFDDLRVTAK